MAGPETGILLMAYGTPERPEDLEAYYTDIRRGRPPSADQLADLRRRYQAIGGLSPLAQRTRAQAGGLQALLDGEEPGRFRVELGYRHVRPSIEEGMAALVEAGVGLVVALVLAPHYSGLSVGAYLQRAEAAWAARGPASGVGLAAVESWHLEPGLVSLLADRLAGALSTVGGTAGDARTAVVFTAHSLPTRILDVGDPYPQQLRETAEAVAVAAGVPEGQWRTAWQSAGRTAEAWLGPDVLEVLRGLPAEGVEGAVVCPAGFVSDHLEVLYDLDVEARAVAESRGLRFARTASLDDDPRFLEVLAAVVRRRV